MKEAHEIVKIVAEERELLEKSQNYDDLFCRLEKVSIGWRYNSPNEERLLCWKIMDLGKIRGRSFGIIFSEEGTDEQRMKWSIVDVENWLFGRYLWFDSLSDAIKEWESSKQEIFPVGEIDVKGMEFEWFSVDEHGFIAVFSTAGFGKVPDFVFQENSDHILLESYFTRTHFGRSEVMIQKNSENKYLRTLAARGLYAYEWSQRKGPYELIFRPSNPLTIKDINDRVAETIANVVLGINHWGDAPIVRLA